jgi:hypothetical protein
VEAGVRIELTNNGFAIHRITTVLTSLKFLKNKSNIYRDKYGAEKEVRTPDPNLGKVMLYR